MESKKAKLGSGERIARKSKDVPSDKNKRFARLDTKGKQKTARYPA